jgi:hypothetical protein
MIPLGTELQPRRPSDAVARTAGIEGDRYVLEPVEFAAPFSLNADEIAARYVCDGFSLAITHETEIEQWARLSNETFAPPVREPVAAEPDPETVFAAAAEAEG